MRRNRFAKIVATLGPASSNIEKIEALVKEGVDMFRLNFSHGEHEVHKKNVEMIRQVEKKLDYHVAILMDLQGPKYRVGRFEEGKVNLVVDQSFTFDKNEALGDKNRVYLSHDEIFDAAKVGDKLLVDDARVGFVVTANDGERLETKVNYGVSISDNKGLNMPDTELAVNPLTEKDEIDLEYGLTLDIDYVALSFVQKPEDMEYLRKRVGDKMSILAKIEKPQAVEAIEAILEVSDAIMIARGDLGVEFAPEKLPALQKYLIKKSREAGKPVVVATQMLESMISSPVATRAEATDVDSAISEGADAVMLSGETAMGDYPIEAVSFMQRMIIETEKNDIYKDRMKVEFSAVDNMAESAISQGVKAIANSGLSLKAIACFTSSGGTAIRLSKERALIPIVATTQDKSLARRLQLYWGINATVMSHENISQFATVMSAGVENIKERGYGEDGDWVVVTVGVPFGAQGSTNTLRLCQIGDDSLKHKLLVK